MAHHEHSHGHNHAHGKDHHPHGKPGIHRRWWFWVAVLLMLGGMVMYVTTLDEALEPGGQINQEVPADAE